MVDPLELWLPLIVQGDVPEDNGLVGAAADHLHPVGRSRWRRPLPAAVLVVVPEETAGMVTIKFGSELPTFNKRLESRLIRFLAHDLNGPSQRRAF